MYRERCEVNLRTPAAVAIYVNPTSMCFPRFFSGQKSMQPLPITYSSVLEQNIWTCVGSTSWVELDRGPLRVVLSPSQARVWQHWHLFSSFGHRRNLRTCQIRRDDPTHTQYIWNACQPPLPLRTMIGVTHGQKMYLRTSTMLYTRRTVCWQAKPHLPAFLYFGADFCAGVSRTRTAKFTQSTDINKAWCGRTEGQDQLSARAGPVSTVPYFLYYRTRVANVERQRACFLYHFIWPTSEDNMSVPRVRFL